MVPEGLKGAVMTINGDRWTVVDVAPAEELAEMVAVILEDEGIVNVVRPADGIGDALSHLGSVRVGTTLVLVPEGDATRALEVIAETVTDYQGPDLEALLEAGWTDGDADEAAAGSTEQGSDEGGTTG